MDLSFVQAKTRSENFLQHESTKDFRRSIKEFFFFGLKAHLYVLLDFSKDLNNW